MIYTLDEYRKKFDLAENNHLIEKPDCEDKIMLEIKNGDKIDFYMLQIKFRCQKAICDWQFKGDF